MSHAPDAKPGPGGGLPVVRLLRDGQDRLVVAPLAAARPPGQAPAAADVFEPFPLPRLPLSLHCWLAGLAGEFDRRHARCLAALFVLDCVRRRWVRPLVPAQACSPDGACWTLDPGDGPRPGPDCRVAGSFQARRRVHDVFEAAATVPPLDGLHVVQAHTGRDWSAFTFVHAGGRTSVVPPDDLMADDWDQTLAEAAGRMKFD